MKATSSRIKSLTSLSVALLTSCSSIFAANDEWWSGNGDWFTGTWQLGTPPTSADVALFNLNTNSTAAAVSVSIGDGQTAVASFLSIARGKTVNLSLGAGAALSATASTWQIGSGSGSGATSAAGHLNITGTSTGERATVAIGSGGMNIGAHASQTGNSVEFSGNLGVQLANTVVVGRFGNSNSMTVKDGATLEGTAIWVSATQNITNGIGNNNSLLVTGTGTSVTLRPTSNTALLVAARPTTDLASSQSGNSIRIEDGAAIRIDSVNSPTLGADVKIGDSTFRNSNFVSVTGAGSLLELKGTTRILIGTNSVSSYDNSLTVDGGGTIKNDGSITINNSRTTNGKNRVVVGSTGTLLVGGAITNNGGLVQLAEGGILRGETVAGVATPVELIVAGLGSSVGRFEAAGSGLASNVSTTIKSGGLMAVGLASASSASTFTVNSSITMESGSTLELDLFGAGAGDSIVLGSGGSLNLSDGVSLVLTLNGYVPEAGNSWTLFSGLTENIIGNFDVSLMTLPTLSEGLLWDYSSLNASGGWQVAVIPEPGSMALLVTAGAVSFAWLRRSRRQNQR